MGRYFSGNGFAHVYFEDALCALVLWGSPGEDDVRVMVRAISSELPPRADHSSFVDARRLTAIDPAAYRFLSQHMGERGPAHDPNIVRHALIDPSGGVAGAAVAGFYAVTPTRTPERTGVFGDAEAALAWLGRDDAPSILDLMLESDAKLSAIAEEVGCASAQHFANLFRKVVGESPSVWRARHRP